MVYNFAGVLSSINQNIVQPMIPLGRPYGTTGSTKPKPIPKENQVRGAGRPRKIPQQNQDSFQPSTSVPTNETIPFDPNVNFCTNKPLQNTPPRIRVVSTSPNLYPPDITNGIRPIASTSTS